MLKSGDYVKAPSKGYPPVFRVIKMVSEKGDLYEVEYVGDLVNGRLGNFTNQRFRCYHKGSNLTPYK